MPSHSSTSFSGKRSFIQVLQAFLKVAFQSAFLWPWDFAQSMNISRACLWSIPNSSLMVSGGEKFSGIVECVSFSDFPIFLFLFGILYIFIFLEEIWRAREGWPKNAMISGAIVALGVDPNLLQYSFKASKIHLGTLSRKSTFSNLSSVIVNVCKYGNY